MYRFFRSQQILFGLSFFYLFIGNSCSKDNKDDAQSLVDHENEIYDLALEPKLSIFKSIASPDEEGKKANGDMVRLGHVLYFDTRLSLNGNNSCNSCHNLEKYGVDNESTSRGDNGVNGGRNSPTVLNAALHASQFWDGRATDVEQQAGMPILNPIEMAIPSEKFLVDRLSALPEMRELFVKAYPQSIDPVNYTNLRTAIAAFERQLITPSRFDKYLNGEKTAISLKEKKGALSFINIGCTNCHSGAAIGGANFQKFGVFKPYWEATGSVNIDKGRYEITLEQTDEYYFKVPSLRNIEKTHPYFHDGSVSDLKRAVKIMADVQLNYKLSEDELENILAFLKSLTGEVPSQYQKAPKI